MLAGVRVLAGCCATALILATGQKLRPQLVDDACDPEQTKAAAQQAISLQPALVLGHSCSMSSILAAPLYAQAKIIQITSTSTNPRLTEMGLGTIFRMIGRDDTEGRTIARRIAASWPHGKIPVLDDGGVQAVFLGENYGVDAALIAREAAQMRLRLTILTGDTQGQSNFWKTLGKSDGSTLFTFAPDPLDEPAGRALYKSARLRNIEANSKTVLSYATVQAWAAAVAQAGSFETGKVAATLHASRFETAVGPVWFDSKGDIQGKMGEWVWYRWRDGKIERAPPPERL